MRFGPFKISVFGILLVTAILVGRCRILHLERAEGRSDERNIAMLCLGMLAGGLVCAHVLKIALADLSAFVAHPSVALQKPYGIMSVGGFYGGLLAGLVWCRLRGITDVESLRMLDRRDTEQRATQPDVEKVHQVGIRNCIVVRRIRDDDVIA